jgi:hypothetical protein
MYLLCGEGAGFDGIVFFNCVTYLGNPLENQNKGEQRKQTQSQGTSESKTQDCMYIILRS